MLKICIIRNRLTEIILVNNKHFFGKYIDGIYKCKLLPLIYLYVCKLRLERKHQQTNDRDGNFSVSIREQSQNIFIYIMELSLSIIVLINSTNAISTYILIYIYRSVSSWTIVFINISWFFIYERNFHLMVYSHIIVPSEY